jgi:dihydrofolate reductase
MKTILIFVSTLDGKITKWGDPKIRSWSSRDDQEYFDKIWKKAHVIIMGSGTYLPDPLAPDPKHLFIVMSRNPDKYKDREVPGQLLFTNESPLHLIMQLEKQGEKKLLIVGGARIATSFLKEQLIDELWLTIEPKIFGSGTSFVAEEKLDINLRLLSLEKINSQGTLITKYAVIQNTKSGSDI